MKMSMSKAGKSELYLGAALGMLIYAVPRLTVGAGWTAANVFSIAWILFALVIVGAHLHAIMRVDEETEAQLERVKKYRRRQFGQWIERGIANRGD